METTTATPAPGHCSGFVPLPSGNASPLITPERARELLGWGLLQTNWR